MPCGLPGPHPSATAKGHHHRVAWCACRHLEPLQAPGPTRTTPTWAGRSGHSTSNRSGNRGPWDPRAAWRGRGRRLPAEASGLRRPCAGRRRGPGALGIDKTSGRAAEGPPKPFGKVGDGGGAPPEGLPVAPGLPRHQGPGPRPPAGRLSESTRRRGRPWASAPGSSSRPCWRRPAAAS